MARRAPKGLFICARQWAPKKTFYVSAPPGKRGDWSYETHPDKARPINSYWKRRFEADMRHVRAVGVTCRKV